MQKPTSAPSPPLPCPTPELGHLCLLLTVPNVPLYRPPQPLSSMMGNQRGNKFAQSHRAERFKSRWDISAPALSSPRPLHLSAIQGWVLPTDASQALTRCQVWCQACALLGRFRVLWAERSGICLHVLPVHSAPIGRSRGPRVLTPCQPILPPQPVSHPLHLPGCPSSMSLLCTPSISS